jgi:xylulokinase
MEIAMREVKYLAGCDVGTGGTKAVVIDLEGNVLGDYYIEYPLITIKEGWEKYPGMKAEHDPMLYWNAVATCFREVIKKAAIDPKYIGGVSVSALSPACILVDQKLKPLANAHIWMDRRATEQCRWLTEHIGDERVFQLSANPIDPYYAISKLMWERDNRPGLYKQAYKMQTAADFPAMMLTGVAVTDYSNASLIGICFDIKKRKWDENLVEEIGLDMEKLPEPFPCDKVIGEVTHKAASETGLAPGTPVVAGTVDCNAAWVAGGAVADGDTSLVLGTAGVLGIVHEEAKFTRHMITIIHTADSGKKYTTLAALVAGGASMRYFRDVFGSLELTEQEMDGIDAYDKLNELAEASPVGAKGLIYLPYLSGERTPIWDTSARGIFFGFGMDHKKGDFIRAMMEGVGYGLYHNFELMKDSGIKINLPIILSEGGAKSRLWRQIIADTLNEPCVWKKESKGAPVGNAIAAGVGIGVYKDYSIAAQWNDTGSQEDLTNPILGNNATYMKYYQIYRQLYIRNKELFEDLSEIHRL